jgi:uncharacterized protein (TIRG00374 family)
MSRSRLWLTVIGLALSAVAVVTLLRSIDAADAARRLGATRPAWFLAACVLTLVGYWLRALRWGEILSPHGRPAIGRLFSATMIGFLAINTLPARIGELVRVYVLARTERLRTATVLGSVAVERIFDLVALGIFWSLSLLFAPYPDWFRWSGVITLGLGLLMAGAFWAIHAFGGWTWAAEASALLRWIPERPRLALTAAIPAFGDGIRVAGRPGVMIRSALWSAAMWAVNGAVFLLVAEALGMRLPLWSPLLLAFVVCVAILLPSSPGFVGVMEGACVVGLGLLGVEGAEALAFGLLYHLVQLLPPILLGSYFAFRGHFGREILDESPRRGQGGGETSGDSGI